MKKLVTFMLTASMLMSSMTAFAAVKDAPAIGAGLEISLDAYNLKGGTDTTSANVSVTKDGVPYEGDFTVYVDDNAVAGKNVTATSEGIHKVTAEVDGEILTTYFAYTNAGSSCAVKDTNPVFFEDFQDDTYEGDGAADLIQSAGGFTGSSGTSSFKIQNDNSGNRPGNTALQFHTAASQAFQTQAFGPELADYIVEYDFRGQNYNGSAQTAIGIHLGLRYSPSDALPENAYRVIYAPFGKKQPSSIADSSGSRIYDVLAIGRTGKNVRYNGMPGYWLSGITTTKNADGVSYTSNTSERTIALTDKNGFAQNKFYKMSAYAFSDTVAATTYDHTTGKNLRTVKVNLNNDSNIQTDGSGVKSTITKGRTVLGAQEYIFRIDDLAIYKLYNCKNMYEEIEETAKAGEPLAIVATMNGVDNNPQTQAIVNYKLSANRMNVYTEGLDFTVDKDASTVTFQSGGKKIIPLEYVGVNGVKKAIVAVVTVEDEQKYDVEDPVITVENGVAKATSKITNTTYFDRSAVLYLASYKNDSKELTAVAISDTVNFAPNTGDTLSAELTLPEDYDNTCSLKAFVWEDMTPLTEGDF